MLVVSVVGNPNKVAVEALLGAAGFVAGDEYYSCLLGVKRECYAPHSIGGFEPQLFHIGVLGVVQSVSVWTLQLGPESLQQLELCRKFILNSLRQVKELCCKVVLKLNFPGHFSKYASLRIMSSSPYDFKAILDGYEPRSDIRIT
jgi:hypothetical protein